MSIPVVDFESVFTSPDLSCTCPQVQQLHSAFTTIGFVFIKNHGIERKVIDEAFAASSLFFNLPVKTKKNYLHDRSRDDDTGNNGYVCLEQESVDPSKPGDLKECFDMCAYHTCSYPDEEVPEFQPTMIKLFEASIRLSNKILELMALALAMPDPLFFVKAHQKQGLGHTESYTTMRLLHYPPLPPSCELKPGQLRCGEHVDYGSITLLFQDPSGGLQVKQADGGYIDVPYMSEAVLVNLGALMQQWTSDKYLATPHRVLIPEDKDKQRMVRQSLAFFVHPDNEVVVECIDGSNKYPPTTAKEDTDKRLHDSYVAYQRNT